MLNPDTFLRVFLSLFVIIDPMANLVVFHVLTRQLSTRDRLTTIAVAIATAGLLLLGFGLGGSHVLDAFGISQASFRVAAGLLLLPMAYRLVVAGELPEVRSQDEHNPFRLGFVPLATPLLAGPGALAAVVTFAGSVGQVTTLAAAAAVLLVCALAFASAGVLFRRLGGTPMQLAVRVVGLLLFAIATEFVLSGAAAALAGRL